MITIMDAALGACTLYFYLIGDFIVFKISLGILLAIALLESIIEVAKRNIK